MSFLNEVKDPRATHNCWAYKVGEQFRYNDDGEPSSTAGKPIYSAISSSGIDMVMVVVIRYFGGIKLGTGGLVRAYGGVAAECLKDAPTCLVKPKARVGMEVPFDLLGTVYNQLQHFHAEDIKQDYDTGKDGTVVVMFKVTPYPDSRGPVAAVGSASKNLILENLIKEKEAKKVDEKERHGLEKKLSNKA
ncbi:hypothetical protein TRIUR3_09989 [Triticum urartu]|uniref:Impact N-terminal domain-containing protein n=1 Tax=Triticum urartu TaxID=4572 RepID=M7YNE6_TRIUA|nr:hypothetical protein TRIUR3_09989 [Triticum urartu]